MAAVLARPLIAPTAAPPSAAAPAAAKPPTITGFSLNICLAVSLLGFLLNSPTLLPTFASLEGVLAASVTIRGFETIAPATTGAATKVATFPAAGSAVKPAFAALKVFKGVIAAAVVKGLLAAALKTLFTVVLEVLAVTPLPVTAAFSVAPTLERRSFCPEIEKKGFENMLISFQI